jgi:hypothetical protein
MDGWYVYSYVRICIPSHTNRLERDPIEK